MLAPIPNGRIQWSDPRLRGAWFVLSLGLLMGIVFFPRIIVNFDEYFYAGQAFTLSRGRLVPTAGDPLPVPPWLPVDAMKYPLGWPMLLAAARLSSFRAMYLVPLAARSGPVPEPPPRPAFS